MKALSDAKVIDSWKKNAGPWARAVRARAIESRRLVTDAAVVDAVAARAPRTVLDVGCGEGWLARALDGKGIAVTGIDGVAELIDGARAAGGGRFGVLAYEDVCREALPGRFDVAVCNFSLIGEESVERLVRALSRMDVGALVVQTLHPAFAVGEAPYRDGWRAGSWAGFDDDFTDPAPWYFRTLASWVDFALTTTLRGG